MGKVKVKLLSRVRLSVTPWTVAYQAPPSIGYSRQEYWRGLPFPFPGNLLDPGIEPGSPAFQADALTSEPPGKPRQNKAPRKDAHVQIPGACERHVTWLCCACLVAQSCPTLCDPMDCSPPGSSVPGILQARVLERVAISISRGSSQLRDRTWVSCIPGRCFNF